MFKTITGLIRLKPGVVPSQFQWTKSSQDRPQNKLQELKTMAEQQEQEERRQSFVDSFQQDVKMEEGETASGGQGASASDEQMEEMATDVFTSSEQSDESKNTKFLKKFCHFRWLVQ